MSATDIVPIYYDGEPQDLPPSQPPLTRAECHLLKRQGAGLFQRSGRIFVIFPKTTPTPEPVSSKFGNVRDESVCVEEPTMRDYVQGIRRAVVIIRAWTPKTLRAPSNRLEALAEA